MKFVRAAVSVGIHACSLFLEVGTTATMTRIVEYARSTGWKKEARLHVNAGVPRLIPPGQRDIDFIWSSGLVVTLPLFGVHW
jgi:hypothetical protein